MKHIAILTCLDATGVCSGAACFAALNKRSKFFERYKGEEVTVEAFFHCNGCTCEYSTDKEYLEKMQRVCSLGLDAAHVGKCTLIKGKECSIISNMIKVIEDNGIPVVRGTH